MRLVTPILKKLVYPSLAATGYLRHRGSKGLAVVTYHGVLPSGYEAIDPGFDGGLITADVFRSQLHLLKRNYNVISPEHMRGWCRGEQELPPRAVLVTCDDGGLNNLTEMVPILHEEGLRCLFFITGASLSEQRTMLWYEELLLLFLRAPDGNFNIRCAGIEIGGVLGEREQRRAVWWSAVKQLSQVDHAMRQCFLAEGYAYFELEPSLDYFLENYAEAQRHFCLLTRTELQQLDAAGMTIGAHTLTHPLLSQLPPEQAWIEITESRTGLESALGKPVWAFAYPFGDDGSVTPRVISMTREAGFEAAFLNIGGGLGSQLPLRTLPRVHVNAGMTLSEFEAHICGFYEMLQQCLRRAPRAYPEGDTADATALPLGVPSTT
jgi:peptidoglycan/xylan/chitin deacetylase (PgdA/CDA1 family)